MNVQAQIDELRARRAAEWFEILSNGSTDQNAEFVAWIAESPRHLDEFLKITALSQVTHQTLRSEGFDRAALLRQVEPKITSLFRSPSVAARELTRKGSAIWRWSAGLAASIALLVAAVLWMRGDFLGGQRYATDIGEQRTLDLPDGSVVYLNAQSQVRVNLGDGSRDIQLLDGEALFRVAHDSKRPFRVHTRDAVVQAIGTQFNVATRTDGTRVAVIEGKVQVSSESQTAPAENTAGTSVPLQANVPTPLSAGEAARVSRAGAFERRPSAEAANAVAWRQRRLVFDGTPLEEAVHEFNRYHRSMQLRLEGVVSGSLHYSGTFDADDPESFADLLSHERDLIVERGDDEIVIRVRQ